MYLVITMVLVEILHIIAPGSLGKNLNLPQVINQDAKVANTTLVNSGWLQWPARGSRKPSSTQAVTLQLEINFRCSHELCKIFKLYI